MSSVAPNVLQEDFTLLLHPDTVAADSGTAPWVYLSVMAAVSALVVGFWWRRTARQAAPGVATTESAGAIALRELARWQPLPPETDQREAVAAVSGTMRRYAEGRFGLPAPKLTTEEFWREQEVRRPMPARHESFWAHFLHLCDTVKYAGRAPTGEQFPILLSSAREFVLGSAPHAPNRLQSSSHE